MLAVLDVNTWEPVVQLALLVILAYLGKREVGGVKKRQLVTQEKVEQAHGAVTESAQAAASAAQASATTARIMKEIGGVLRENHGQPLQAIETVGTEIAHREAGTTGTTDTPDKGGS
jgi:hypothetical protein